jgi:hypothetical protein
MPERHLAVQRLRALQTPGKPKAVSDRAVPYSAFAILFALAALAARAFARFAASLALAAADSFRFGPVFVFPPF